MNKDKQQEDKNEFSSSLSKIASFEAGLDGVESDRLAFVAGLEAGTDVYSSFDTMDGRCGCGETRAQRDKALAEAGADLDRVYDMEVTHDTKTANRDCGCGCKKNLKAGRTNVEAGEDMMTDINVGMGSDTDAPNDSNFYFGGSFPATKGMEAGADLYVSESGDSEFGSDASGLDGSLEAGADENFSFNSDNGVTENTPYKNMAKYKMIPDMDESEKLSNNQGS